MAELVYLPAGRQARTAKMYYLYVLKSIGLSGYYKGLTSNLEKRLDQHYSGKEPTTRKMLPLKLIHVELCDSRTEARTIEKFFKSGYGREVIKEIDISN